MIAYRSTFMLTAVGAHACECGHPKMRCLPDGVYHCPACGSEVLPAKTTLVPRDYTADRLSHGLQERDFSQIPMRH